MRVLQCRADDESGQHPFVSIRNNHSAYDLLKSKQLDCFQTGIICTIFAQLPCLQGQLIDSLPKLSM
jgi:hypothetical protein